MVASRQPLLKEQGVEAEELEGARRPLAPIPRGPDHARGQHHDSGGNAEGKMVNQDPRVGIITKM